MFKIISEHNMQIGYLCITRTMSYVTDPSMMPIILTTTTLTFSQLYNVLSLCNKSYNIKNLIQFIYFL